MGKPKIKKLNILVVAVAIGLAIGVVRHVRLGGKAGGGDIQVGCGGPIL